MGNTRGEYDFSSRIEAAFFAPLCSAKISFGSRPVGMGSHPPPPLEKILSASLATHRQILRLFKILTHLVFQFFWSDTHQKYVLGTVYFGRLEKMTF